MEHCVARLNLSVPDGPKGRMDAIPEGRVNWSAVIRPVLERRGQL